ncbi:MAG: tRNA pseudouridine(55) synthase TruB, partial [Aquihabitans sp.]
TLRRTSVGPFTLADAVPLELVSPEVVRPMVDAVRHLDWVTADAAMAEAVRIGKVFEAGELGVSGDGPWAVIDEAGELLAVYEPFRASTVKPAVVIVR